MSGFVGTWQHVKSENLDAFFKAMGMNIIVRKMASKSNPKITIENDGVVWKIKVQMNPVLKSEIECTEGQEFIESELFEIINLSLIEYVFILNKF